MQSHLLKIIYFILGLVATGYGLVWFISEFKLRDVTYPSKFTATIPYDSLSLERGRHIARTRGCFGCHGQQLEGLVFTDQWPWVKRAVAPNLARITKEYSVEVLELAIRHGIGHDGRALWSMPSYNWANLEDGDLSALIGYLRSEEIKEKDLPRPALGFAARLDIVLDRGMHMAEWASMVPPLEYATNPDSSLRKGEYLAKTTCNECHGLDLKGDYQPDFITPSLSILAAYSDEEFRRLMSTGVSRDGREELGLMTVVAKDRFAYFTEQELTDLLSFLRTIATE
jgi:mono/diheme cytochrome c family protein